MEMKILEVRDSATFITCLAIYIGNFHKLSPKLKFLVQRAGYSNCSPCILFGKLEGGEFKHDIYEHSSSRTLKVAHDYVEQNWDAIEDGELIDVEFILKETYTRKSSEFYSAQVEGMCSGNLIDLMDSVDE